MSFCVLVLDASDGGFPAWLHWTLAVGALAGFIGTLIGILVVICAIAAEVLEDLLRASVRTVLDEMRQEREFRDVQRVQIQEHIKQHQEGVVGSAMGIEDRR